jgi:predicted phage terminase large subunit-like protein
MNKISKEKQKEIFKKIKNGELSEEQKELFLNAIKLQNNYIDDYLGYLKKVYGDRFFVSKHVKYMATKIDELINGTLINEYNEKVKILLISCPPQHSKSLTITEALPSYYLGKYPNKRIIQISYNDTFAQKFARRNREKIKEFGKDIYNIEISMNKDSNEEFELVKKHGLLTAGSMVSRGILSGITGNPADLIIIDDPIKNREEAESTTIKDKIWDEWLNSIKTRLSSNGIIVVIQTRWSEDDLIGRLIKYETNLLYINFTCEAEENDILGRYIGEALFPEIGKDNKWVQDMKSSYMKDPIKGYRAWLALFQGRPTIIDGDFIKRKWWKFWKPIGSNLPDIRLDGENITIIELPEYLDETIQSWDCAFKDGKHNDYVAGTVWGRRIQEYFLLDLINEHYTILDTLKAIEEMVTKYPRLSKTLIEDKANGSAVIQMLRNKLSGIIPVNPKGGKESRVNAIIPAIESGNVYLPHPAMCPWVNDFIEQCSKFPNGLHDDMVDSMSQALNILIYKKGDTFKQDDIKHGSTWYRNELIMRGYKNFQINKMIKDGKILLIGR